MSWRPEFDCPGDTGYKEASNWNWEKLSDLINGPLRNPARCGHPTTSTTLQIDGPNHLGLRCNAFHRHRMARITSGCVPFRLREVLKSEFVKSILSFVLPVSHGLPLPSLWIILTAAVG